MGLRALLAVCGTLLVLAETEAHAYTDPGSGTLLLQMAFAAFFGLMFYLRRIVAWMRRLLGKEGDSVSASAAPPEADGWSSDSTADR